MPGRPMLRALERDIEERGGIDWLCAQIENGRTLTKIGDELGVSRHLVAKYVKLDSSRVPKYEEARRASAHTLVDEARDLVDDSPAADMHKVREQVKMRQWSAERFDRDAFGTPKEPALQVNIGQLHLNAMKQQREIEEAEITNVLPAETAEVLPSSDSLDESLELPSCDETPNVDVTELREPTN